MEALDPQSAGGWTVLLCVVASFRHMPDASLPQSTSASPARGDALDALLALSAPFAGQRRIMYSLNDDQVSRLGM